MLTAELRVRCRTTWSSVCMSVEAVDLAHKEEESESGRAAELNCTEISRLDGACRQETLLGRRRCVPY